MFSNRRKSIWGIWLSFVILLGLFAIPSGSGQALAGSSPEKSANPNKLEEAFANAAQEFDVPVRILKSVSYNESRWNQHHGHPSTSGGYGVMHLTQVDNVSKNAAKGETHRTSSAEVKDPKLHTLDKAAKLLGMDPEVLIHNPVQNIRGGAALLAEYAQQTVGGTPAEPSDWYGAVAKYSESDYEAVAKDFANRVYKTIQQGKTRTTPSGQHVTLAARKVQPDKDTADSLHLRNTKWTNTDCPNGVACRFIPAAYKQYSSSLRNYGNYDLAKRPEDGLDIRYIIIHDTESSYASAINTFQSQSYVSAHYVIRSSDGQITEMVRPDDVAWQAGNWYVNMHSIGIEHEGVAAEGATWYSEQMYHASAKLVKYLAKRYSIPLDRQHIFGHDEVPGTGPDDQSTMHWDPSAYWNWDHYFDLLGAPIKQGMGKVRKNSDIVTLDPNFHTNKPPLKYGNTPLKPQPSNFVYLYTAPSFDAPLFGDPALHPNGPGTTQIYDWGDKAVTGQSFYKAGQQGDWTAIYYAGHKVWFYNPDDKNTVSGNGLLITPKKGLDSIPVYGTPYPEDQAYELYNIPQWARNYPTPLQYKIPAGQIYVAEKPFAGDFYFAKYYNKPETNKVVKGDTEYYQIAFNHRVAYVKASDVQIVKR
ncbi:MAG TPA: N-acetylmuramoyl-L-alanine amidase [Bacillales bacterium]|nr:N-acetylmuramoyl-L-alanine amidase [Bacillales bacterium]